MPKNQPEANNTATEFRVGRFFGRKIYSFVSTVKRFPLAIVFLIILPFQVGNLNPYYASLNLFDKQKQAYIVLAGAVWFAVIELFAGHYNWGIQKRYSIGLPIFIAICWFISQSVGLTTSSADIFILAILLSATFVPWLFKPMDNWSFWVFNYRWIFNGFLAFVIFCFLLPDLLDIFYPGFEYQPGLGSALMPIFYSISVFWLLSKIPKKLEYTQADFDVITEFPKQIMTVLMPVLFLALMGLNGYLIFNEFKIDGFGKIAFWLITLNFVIYFSYCSFYPEQDASGHWVYKNLHWLLILPTFLLLYAIYIRVNQFGLTEPRYFAALICICYLLIILWLFCTGTNNFRLDRIPKLLAGLCFLSAFGPWQIGRLPVENQFARLQTLLERENLFVAGRYVIPTVDKQPSLQSRKQIWESLYFLIYKIDINRFRAWFVDTDEFDRHVTCGVHRNCRQKTHVNIDLARYMNIMPAKSENTDTSQHVSYDIVYKDVNADNPMFLQFSEAELALGDIHHAENRFYAVDGYDFIKPFPPGSSNDQIKGGIWLVRPKTKNAPNQAIDLEFSGLDKLILTIGEINLDWVKSYPLENAAAPTEALGKKGHFSGKVRTLQLDLAQYVEQLFAKYPEQLSKMPSQSDYYNGKIFWLPEDKNGSNPLVLEKKENGLHVKIEMQTLNVYIDSVDGKKKIRTFTGMLYLKCIEHETAKAIVQEIVSVKPMQVNPKLKSMTDTADGNKMAEGFVAVNGYDFIKFFSPHYPANESGYWEAVPRTKKLPKQTLALRFSNPDPLILSIGNANVHKPNMSSADPDYEKTSPEEVEKLYYFSGKIRQVHLDLTQAIDPKTHKIPKQSNNIPVSQFSDIDNTPFTVIEKTEEGVHVKFEIQTKSIEVDKKTGKKSLTDFTGIMLVKQL